MTELQSLFIQNLKRNRARKGLTQAELAERCGLSANFISNIESGKKYPSVTTMQGIADSLGVKPYQLFIDDDDAETLGYEEVLMRYSESLKEMVDSVIEESRKSFRPENGDDP
jgi:transcriptional regulator with XRE-family HTH domain